MYYVCPRCENTFSVEPKNGMCSSCGTVVELVEETSDEEQDEDPTDLNGHPFDCSECHGGYPHSCPTCPVMN